MLEMEENAYEEERKEFMYSRLIDSGVLCLGSTTGGSRK
jgi:hypothetical protein